MHSILHWNWSAIGAVGMLVVVIMGILWRAYRNLTAQNKAQEAVARRIKREVLGEDDDDPHAVPGPSIRVMINQVIDQTRPLVSTVEEHGRRLGKAESEISDHATRLTALEQERRLLGPGL